MSLQPRKFEISWPSVSTLLWDGDELVDMTTKQKARFDGIVAKREWNMTYRFDRATGFRHRNAFWCAVYENRGTKAVLIKNGAVHRELNRSYYCAGSYDYPITIAADQAGRTVVAHCPQEFNLLEIEDAESGETLRKINSKDMEFHSRLGLSSDGRYLLDAGWFWHPWCGACVFDLGLEPTGAPTPERVAFTSDIEVDCVAFLGQTRLVVSSSCDEPDGEVASGNLGPRQLGIWSLANRKWECKTDLGEPTGLIMPWNEWCVSFYGHPKLIELATGRIVHRWDDIFSGRQVGPIQLGDPPPPPMALDPVGGRFAVASSTGVTVISL